MTDPAITGTHRPLAVYAIQHVRNDLLFWNQKHGRIRSMDGWVDFAWADLFWEGQTTTFTLPIDGKWVVVQP